MNVVIGVQYGINEANAIVAINENHSGMLKNKSVLINSRHTPTIYTRLSAVGRRRLFCSNASYFSFKVAFKLCVLEDSELFVMLLSKFLGYLS